MLSQSTSGVDGTQEMLPNRVAPQHLRKQQKTEGHSLTPHAEAGPENWEKIFWRCSEGNHKILMGDKLTLDLVEGTSVSEDTGQTESRQTGPLGSSHFGTIPSCSLCSNGIRPQLSTSNWTSKYTRLPVSWVYISEGSHVTWNLHHIDVHTFLLLIHLSLWRPQPWTWQCQRKTLFSPIDPTECVQRAEKKNRWTHQEKRKLDNGKNKLVEYVYNYKHLFK